MEIEQVKKYNHKAQLRYERAVEAVKSNEAYPSPAFYIFFNEDGEPRTKGWIVSWGKDSHQWFPNKQEAKAFKPNQ